LTRIRLCSKGFGRDRRHIIGTHWFQMVDNLPTGRPSDEERLNYGFINVR